MQNKASKVPKKKAPRILYNFNNMQETHPKGRVIIWTILSLRRKMKCNLKIKMQPTESEQLFSMHILFIASRIYKIS